MATRRQITEWNRNENEMVGVHRWTTLTILTILHHCTERLEMQFVSISFSMFAGLVLSLLNEMFAFKATQPIQPEKHTNIDLHSLFHLQSWNRFMTSYSFFSFIHSFYLFNAIEDDDDDDWDS